MLTHMTMCCNYQNIGMSPQFFPLSNLLKFIFAGRTDMLSLMAMHWNQQKVDNLATSLCRRYQKVITSLMLFKMFNILFGSIFTLFSCLWFFVIVGRQKSSDPAAETGITEGRISRVREPVGGLGKGCEAVGRKWGIRFDNAHINCQNVFKILKDNGLCINWASVSVQGIVHRKFQHVMSEI